MAMLIARPPWVLSLTLLIFAVLGITSGRGVAWWPFVAAATVAALIQVPAAARTSATTHAAGERKTPQRPSRLNAGIAGLLLLAGLAILPTWRPIGAARAPLG